MIVPDHWAEARLQRREGERQLTVRRFGWSESNLQEAELMARQRVEAALQQALSGQPLLRREPKRAYNGAEGVPIREEVLERRGPEVISRNSYGAHCLNSPRVLFADVAHAESARGLCAAARCGGRCTWSPQRILVGSS